MSAYLSSGQESLLLNINAPVDYDGELRDDVFGAKVWYSTTDSDFDPSNNEGTLAYDGNSLNITIPDLTAGTTYYVKYAIISDIDPDVYTISATLTGVPIATKQVATAVLYQWSPTEPSSPTGTSTFTWATGSSSNYTGANGWELAIPSNPGTQNVQLWQASKQVVAYPADVTTTVSWSSDYTVRSISSNGGDGTSAKLIRLVATGNAFTYDTAGVASPASQTLSFTAILEGMSGTATFTAQRYDSSNVLIDTITLGSTGNTRTLTDTQFGTAAYCIITATLSDQSDTQRVVRLSNGAAGSNGRRTAVLDLYKWSATEPTTNFPSGTSTYTWASASFTSPATLNDWTAVPGTPVTGQTLWIARQVYTDTSTSAQSTVTWSVSTALSLTSAGTNGTKGDTGANAVSGLLTNESAVVAASSDGTVTSLTNAGGTFKVWDGTTDKTGNAAVTYSVVADSATGITISIAATGIYTITGMSADTGSAVLRAVYNGVTIDKVYTIAKSRAGATGGTGAAGLQSAKPTVYRWDTSTPTGPSGTATYTWATGAFGDAPADWSLTPDDGSLGQTLYAAGVTVTDTANNATTAFNWTNASISIAAYKGTNGNPGSNGTRTAVLTLYQWAASEPTLFPSGTSTYTWATGAYGLPATPNDWTLAPGTPAAGQKLYTVTQIYSDANTSATSTVTWSASTTNILSAAGTNGARYAFPKLYRWATATPSSVPNGNWTYTWAGGSIAVATGKSNGWSSTVPAPIAGYTLYQLQTTLAETTDQPQTTFAWTGVTYAITPLSYAGNQGASSRTCYSRIANNPAPTSGSITSTGDVVPTQAQSLTTWGLDVAWATSDPDTSSTNTLYQSDGIYNPATNQTVWTTPYIASLKVGSLSAVSTNTGSLTVTGKFQADTAEVSGTTMTGEGGVINEDGSFAFGNATTNISFNGTQLTLNGNVVNTANIPDNAITKLAYADGSVITSQNGVPKYSYAEVTIAIEAAAAGKPILIIGSANQTGSQYSTWGNCILYKNGTALTGYQNVYMYNGAAFYYLDTPAEGTHTYKMEVNTVPNQGYSGRAVIRILQGKR